LVEGGWRGVDTVMCIGESSSTVSQMWEGGGWRGDS
jgi:hypothetical protein